MGNSFTHQIERKQRYCTNHNNGYRLQASEVLGTGDRSKQRKGRLFFRLRFTQLLLIDEQTCRMAPRKDKFQKDEVQVQLGPYVGDGEIVHIYASFNDTFVHDTDLSGRETIARVTGGINVKADRDEASLYAAMLAAQDVAEMCKLLGITALRATGGNKTKIRCPVRSACFGPFVHEDRPRRGRHPHPIGLHPQEGRSPWSSSLKMCTTRF